MSKYIRTEDKIIDVSYWEKDDKGNYYTWESDDFCSDRKYIYKTDIIEESDNLEDLCDEYVAKWKLKEDKKKYMVRKYDYWQDKDINNLFLEMSYLVPGPAVDYMNIYGAIWTDKGLIYVAKLNKDEEWELI